MNPTNNPLSPPPRSALLPPDQAVEPLFYRRLRDGLDGLDRQTLRRWLRPLPSTGRLVRLAGRELLNLAGNDYLGLAEHPHLKETAIRAIEQHGVGATASRLVAGHLDLHAQIESRFAAFKHAEAGLLLPTGYAANLAVLTALAGPGDLICQDKLNHASLLDAAQASGARVRTFPHRDYAKLERLLKKHADRGVSTSGGGPLGQRFIVTDAVFSMDGNVADLPALCALAERHDAVLVVDEAHGTGVLGGDGAGLASAQGVADRVPITVSTASKALGGLGGLVTGPRVVIDTLINRARPLIYSTAVPPAQAATIGAALDVIRDEPERRLWLAELSKRLRTQLAAAGWAGLCGGDDLYPTPIVPLIVGSSEAAVALQKQLEHHHILAVAIRPPTVAPRSARVRLSLRADMTDADLSLIVSAAGSPPR
ncbi:MAG: 8-amino-7-oxononanoate synthase [Planctomycetota bacterium]